jgi:L-2-hydroxyglutarate oxidase LhgO
MPLGSTGSLTNYLMSGTKGQPVPAVGMGATLLGWTDRHPATIVAVGPNARWVDAQDDDYKRIDKNGMSESQEYEFSPNPKAPIVRYSLRKDGGYVRVGDSMSGARLRIGDRDCYYDFSF